MKLKNHSKNKSHSFRIVVMAMMLSFFFACTKDDSILLNQKSQNVDLEEQANSRNLKSSDTGNGKYVIEPANGITLDQVAVDAKSLGASIERVQQQLGYVVVRSSSATFKADLAKKLTVGSITTSYDVNWTPEVKAIDADQNDLVLPTSGFINNNFYYPLQWSHRAINSEGAWQLGYTGNGAVVAVIDGGFYPNHPDIKDNVLLSLSKSFVNGEALQKVGNSFGHGTHVAGIIAAVNNNIGTIGVAPEAKLILVKVLADAGYGSFEDVAAGIVYAADQGVDIINMSLGANIPRTFNSSYTSGIRSLINFVNKAVKYAQFKGVTVIVAAGNEGENPTLSGNLVSPVGAPGSIGVSALAPYGWAYDQSVNLDGFASYSNWGINTVDISGSGGDFTLYPDPNYRYDMVLSPSGLSNYYFAAGTSMASPQVAGVAALIVGKYGKMKPADLKTRLFKCADDLGKTGRDEFYGHGRVNAYNAVK